MNVSKKSGISRIREGVKFSLDGVPLNTFKVLGKQTKDNSIIHTVFLKNISLGNTCFTHPKIKLSGYCSYSLIGCETAGILGVVFYSFADKTKVTPTSLLLSRQVQTDGDFTETFTPSFVLETLNVFVYNSNCGSVLAIPSSVDENLLLVYSN